MALTIVWPSRPLQAECSTQLIHYNLTWVFPEHDLSLLRCPTVWASLHKELSPAFQVKRQMSASLRSSQPSSPVAPPVPLSPASFTETVGRRIFLVPTVLQPLLLEATPQPDTTLPSNQTLTEAVKAPHTCIPRLWSHCGSVGAMFPPSLCPLLFASSFSWVLIRCLLLSGCQSDSIPLPDY